MAMATKDELRDLFQERFAGHEVPVDPGTWSAISSQLASGAAATSAVDDLFRDRFSGHEADVDPGVWDAISGQLGHGAATGGGAASGWGAVAGWAAAGITVLVMVGGAVLWSQQNETASDREVVGVAVPVPAPQPEANANNPNTEPAQDEIGTSLEPLPAPSQAQTPIAADDSRDVRIDQTTEVVVADPNESPQDSEPDPGTEPDQGPQAGMAVVEQVVSTMTAEVEHEPLRPATVPDPRLEEEEAPMQAPENFGSDAPSIPFHIFLPNVFTPNHDNYNDDYLPLGEGIVSAIIRVYSLTGNELVFRANALEPWDGTNMFTGQACPEGHYLYAIEAIGADGQAHTEGQTVRLLREFR